jgi:hypothetical protein
MGAGTRNVNMQVKDPVGDGDWLDAALLADAAEHRAEHIADGGFAARVMAGLPRPTALAAWRRPVVALLWLGAGAAAVMAIPGLFDDVFRSAVALVVGHRIGVADVVALLVIPSMAACGMLVYAAQVD